MRKLNGLPCVIVGRDGRPRWSEVWDHNPYILKRAAGRQYNKIVNGGGARPYIDMKTVDRWVWKPYKPIPAEIFLTAEELAFAEPYRGMVMIEPNVKAIGHTNKAWIWDRWTDLVADRQAGLHELSLQCGARDARRLQGTMWVETPTFRHAAAVLSVCRAFVGTEGGLAHAAAAVGTPAVILWSEFISPDITGYAQHRNIRHAGKACGSRHDCAGCRKSMEAITVSEVLANLGEIL